ncbi:MAG TPA: hypothetical protein VM049_11900 [Gaiellaceae bacterium]|nr:hypothetical protein [Gaiellaceae bacterium]
MTSGPERRPRPPKRNPLWRPLLVLVGLLVVLLLGVSLGRALEDGPSPGGVQTRVRILKPQPLPPATRTVTVTVTSG